jgi:hypothetical protein
VDSMRKAHAKFKGNTGRVAQFGMGFSHGIHPCGLG